jgi:hypothetical protein
MRITLSNGTTISSESIERAEFYDMEAFAESGCSFRALATKQLPLLFIQLQDGCERISGAAALSDLRVLEAANVYVIR